GWIFSEKNGIRRIENTAVCGGLYCVSVSTCPGSPWNPGGPAGPCSPLSPAGPHCRGMPTAPGWSVVPLLVLTAGPEGPWAPTSPSFPGAPWVERKMLGFRH
uniref:Uncharacterized protein n=1 Tax=Cynoglossus semilaevis TaxID=244447 RepID=A0A3P8W3C2_CYNSE